MATYTLNVGLENNIIFDKGGVDAVIDKIDSMTDGNVADSKIVTSTYLDNPERTLVIDIVVEPSNIKKLVTNMCKVFTQEAIPYMNKTNNLDAELVYNPDFTGEKYEFDAQYFVEM